MASNPPTSPKTMARNAEAAAPPGSPSGSLSSVSTPGKGERVGGDFVILSPVKSEGGASRSTGPFDRKAEDESEAASSRSLLSTRAAGGLLQHDLDSLYSSSISSGTVSSGTISSGSSVWSEESSSVHSLGPFRHVTLEEINAEEAAEAEYQAKKEKAEAASKQMLKNLEIIRGHMKELRQAEREIQEAHHENARLGVKLIELIEEEEAAKEGAEKRNEELSEEVQAKREDAASLEIGFGDALKQMEDVCGALEKLGE